VLHQFQSAPSIPTETCLACTFQAKRGNENGNGNEEGKTKISDEDLEMPFVEYLSKIRLPPKIRSYKTVFAFLYQEGSRVSTGFNRVDPPGRPGFSGPTPRRVFT
jgi:hypothetical protein